MCAVVNMGVEVMADRGDSTGTARAPAVVVAVAVVAVVADVVTGVEAAVAADFAAIAIAGKAADDMWQSQAC